MVRHLDELKRVFQALEIDSPTAFTLGGRTFAVEGGSAPGAFVARLSHVLYDHCYCRRFLGELPEPEPAPRSEEATAAALTGANTSRVCWETGWYVGAVLAEGEVLACKQQRWKLLRAGEYVTPNEAGVTPRPGAALLVYRPRESWTLQPGFYYAHGETLAELANEHAVLRFYWNVRPSGAARLIGLLTRRLNQFQVPFALKCLTGADYQGRRDPAVLFTQRRFHRLLIELLGDAAARLRADLEPDTPLFTLPLAPGLALAEDPGTGDSFGLTRCRLVALALQDSHARGDHSEAGRLEAVAVRFREAGISLERPYATSALCYEEARDVAGLH